MREIGISPRFSRDKFVPLQTKQRYSTRDISGEVSLTLFFRGFVPFLSLADFVSRNKNLQVADLQRLKSCFGELVTATTSNHQHGLLLTKPLHHSQKESRPFAQYENDCYGEVILMAEPNRELRGKILAYGQFLEVISPQSFRDSIIDILNLQLKQYEK